uniref:Putative DUX4 protein n=1 Tax=Echinops telfairi TaxID=9371 RepID=A7E3J8_ECHTE|nr:TPA: putative DUX4 protein [Echinops telfairi]
MASNDAPACSQRTQDRRKRIVWTTSQLEMLQASFARDPYPGITAREELARDTGVAEDRIFLWFKNRRSRQLRRSRLSSGPAPGEPCPVPPPATSRARAPKADRRKRTVITKDQTAYLVQAFEEQRFPGMAARQELARQTGLPESRIDTWFQNRRVRHPRPIKVPLDPRGLDRSSSSSVFTCPVLQPLEQSAPIDAQRPPSLGFGSGGDGGSRQVACVMGCQASRGPVAYQGQMPQEFTHARRPLAAQRLYLDLSSSGTHNPKQQDTLSSTAQWQHPSLWEHPNLSWQGPAPAHTGAPVEWGPGQAPSVSAQRQLTGETHLHNGQGTLLQGTPALLAQASQQSASFLDQLLDDMEIQQNAQPLVTQQEPGLESEPPLQLSWHGPAPAHTGSPVEWKPGLDLSGSAQRQLTGETHLHNQQATLLQGSPALLTQASQQGGSFLDQLLDDMEIQQDAQPLVTQQESGLVPEPPLQFPISEELYEEYLRDF